jgi:hypothetical protein
VIGIAGRVRSVLKRGPHNLDELIEQFNARADPAGVEHLMLAVLMLYAIKELSMDEMGKLVLSI